MHNSQSVFYRAVHRISDKGAVLIPRGGGEKSLHNFTRGALDTPFGCMSGFPWFFARIKHISMFSKQKMKFNNFGKICIPSRQCSINGTYQFLKNHWGDFDEIRNLS